MVYARRPDAADTSAPRRFPDPEKISPPLLQLNEVTFGYTKDKPILKSVNIDVGLDSRIAVIGPNGAGKSTLFVRAVPAEQTRLLTGPIRRTGSSC